MHRRTGPAPGTMAWGGIGFHCRTHLIRIAGTFKSQGYLGDVGARDAPIHSALIFQQDNARPHVAHNLQEFFFTHHIELFPLSSCSPDLSPFESMWSMLVQRLPRDTETAAIYIHQINFGNMSKPQGLLYQTATAGWDVVQSGRLIFDDFFQHLWPYIGNNTANVVFQMVKRLWLIRIDQ
ncbi:transposable element Tcb1 transposase [Trichonephila clavipes]|nr:transposable element Tcb1 transposase [Trichonephila clavipes]